MNQLNTAIEFTTDLKAMQLDVIHGYLTRSYWAKGISRALVEKSMRHSLCFGVLMDGNQIGFARVITDQATFAYLADVFILEDYQGQGFAKQLMRYILDYPALQGLRRLLLCTADAHELYRQFGFSEAKAPENLMAIHNPEIYSN